MARKIIIIEDNECDVELLREALNRHGVEHDSTVIRDGAAALEFAREANSAAGLPCLIILDLNLPKRHGLEVLEAIRRSPVLADARVAVCTTSDSPVERDRAERIGVQAYLHKPVDFDGFMALGAVFKELCGTEEGAG